MKVYLNKNGREKEFSKTSKSVKLQQIHMDTHTIRIERKILFKNFYHK